MEINWGIIGTGQIARKFAEDYPAVSDGKILAVASRTMDKAESFADEFQIERAYGNYNDLVKDPDVHAVYIATPHSHHFEHSMLAMQHDKAVLCEKAVALNSAELKQMTEMARERNVLFMEAMWTYFLPPVKRAMQWIWDDEIGKVQLIKADFGFSMPFDPESRVFNPYLAGGALLDVGIYPIALASLIMQKGPGEIQVISKKGKSSVDVTTAMTFLYDNDVIARLDCSVENHTSHEAWIYGSHGHIYIPDFWRAKKAYLETPEQKITYEDPRSTAGYNYEIEEMNRLIREGKTESQVMPFVNSFLNMGIMDKIREKIELKYPME